MDLSSLNSLYYCAHEYIFIRPKLWDLALDHGPKCIDCLKNLVRVITFPPHALIDCMPCERGGGHSKRLSHLSCSQYSFKEHI